MPSETTTLVKRYRLVRRLGAGGMGEVFLAQDTELDRAVALKLMSTELAADENQRKRFRGEAKAASRLVHPNVCVIHEVGESEDGRPFLAMEFIDGQTLDQLLVQRRLRIRETLSIGIDVAQALASAHAMGMVHRDIKPGNIMVDRNGRAKVLDFGLAKRFGDDHLASASTAAHTRTGMLIGTPHYMSPEQALGREVDARTDIFSLGAVLYEMVTGGKSFRGQTVGETINNVINQKPEPLGLENPAYTPALDRIIFRCLEKDPANRYFNAEELANDLSRLKETSECTVAAEVSAPSPAAVPSATKERPPTELWRAVTRSTRQGTPGILVMAVALVVLVAIGIWSVLQGRLPKTPSSSARQAATAQPAIPEKSVAVLPFDNISAEPDTEYLSDGFTEEVTSALSRIAGLKIAARNSAFAFKNKREDIRKIGEALRVSTVLEGSVRKVGNQVRVTAQLINAADGFHMWSESYDRPIDDLIAVQEEIAGKIAQRLQGKNILSQAQGKTSDPEAHKRYLQARLYWNRRTESALQEAVKLFKEAISKDPDYADAHAGLAATYLLMPIYSGAKQEEFGPLARASANRALELDPTSAEAHAVLAQLQSRLGDLKGAEEHYRRAIALNPNYATAHHWYGQFLELNGRREDGLKELQTAVEIDPLSPIIRTTIPEWYFFGGEYDRAAAESRIVIAAHPDFPLARGMLVQVLTAKGAYQEAFDEVEGAQAAFPTASEGFLEQRGFLLGRLGRKEEALQLLNDTVQTNPGLRRALNLEFNVHLGLRDYDQAIAALEKIAQEGYFEAKEARATPWFKEMENHPRFQALCKKYEKRG